MEIIKEYRGSKITDRDYKFLLLLEEDELFQELIKIGRTKSNISPQGHSKNEQLKTLTSDEKYKLVSGANVICNLYNLDQISWIRVFVHAILHNELIPPLERPKIEIKRFGNQVRIIINSNISKKEITNYINNYDKLNSYLEKLPDVKTPRVENIELKKEIKMLLKNKSTLEVSKIISEQYDNLPFDPSYEIIGTEMRRFNKTIQNLATVSKRVAHKELINKHKDSNSQN